MKKRMIGSILAGMAALSLWGCQKEKTVEVPSAAAAETGQQPESPEPEEALGEEAPKAEQAAETSPLSADEAFSFGKFERLQFTFYSGAGGWGTLMNIDADGNFSGEYFDSEMGVTGEGYPNGTMYQCLFSGTFTEPVQVNDFTYSMQIQEIRYEEEPGTEEILNGTKYCYGKPYGLDGAEDILIYAPGAPLTELPQAYRDWVGYHDLSMTADTELPFWGLYNEAQECGFASHDVVERIKEQVAIQEEVVAGLEKDMENESFTQAEYNETAQRLYEEWDYALNVVWNALKQKLDEEEMQALTEEERAWIAMKEEKVAKVGEEADGGTMRPMEMSLTAAELTKTRVYELMELLEK